MQIDFEKFLKITVLLAGSAAAAVGCQVDDVDTAEPNGTGGTRPNDPSGGRSGNPGSSGSGTDAGAPSGGTDASAGSGGIAGDAAGGAPEGGNSAAGNAGGGAGGAGGAVGSGGDAGSGGAGPCVSGAPAEEGEGFDCSTLPFAGDTCPNPSGEGARVPVPGFELCDRYTAARTGPLELLTDCLEALDPDMDQCTPAGAAAARACETAMQTGTCASAEAATACADIHDRCDAISEAQCVLDLSPLGPGKAGAVRDCLADSDSTQCNYVYGSCRELPAQVIDVTDACDKVLDVCPEVSRSACETSLDIYETGKLLDLTYYYYRDCMAKSSESCGAAFTSCVD